MVEREPFGMILLIVIGCLVLIVALVLIIVRCYTARAEREERENEITFVQKIGNLVGQVSQHYTSYIHSKLPEQ